MIFKVKKGNKIQKKKNMNGGKIKDHARLSPENSSI